MSAVADLLNSAGPFAGWVCFALVVVGLLWMYASDRLVSIGRHKEQADHYEQRLRELEDRVDAHASDRSYWRDTALDLMAVAAKVTRDE